MSSAPTAGFTDEEIFELEMKHIFEGNWIYLFARASCQCGDYFTTYIGDDHGDHPRRQRGVSAVSSMHARTAVR